MVNIIRPHIIFLFLICGALLGRSVADAATAVAPMDGVLTFHNDLASTGSNAKEMKLSPANVKTGVFGKLYTTPVDGQVYAEPLVAMAVPIAKGVNTKADAEGVHDVVFVATQNDSLYAIDAGALGGSVLWQRAFLDINNAGGNQNNTLKATAIEPLTNNDVGTGDIQPNLGITGTPVIDAATNTLYVVAKTKETIGGNTHFVQRLHAINIFDGTDRTQPFLIGDTVNGNTNNTPIYVYGTGDGNVNRNGKQVVEFNALREHGRGALNLVNNTLYVEWASHGDNGPYHGWVACWNIKDLATAGFQLTGVLNVTPNDGLSGIWQGGGRLAFEPDGSAFYFETGNGDGKSPTINADGFPANAAYNEALVKVVADPTTTPAHQNANGWGLKVADYFIPYNVTAMDKADSDFGSGGAVLLPDTAGIPGHPHLIIGGGKDGKLFVFDRDNLGHFDKAGDHVLNAVKNGSGQNTPENVIGGLLSTPAWFNGKLYVVGGFNSQAYSFRVEQNGKLTLTSQSNSSPLGYLPGSPVVSSNGINNGIVWVMDRTGNQIRAFDANTMATELWNSNQRDDLDALGAVMKLSAPTVYNGMVYVGTSGSLVVYGLVQPPNAAPLAPVLAATPLWGSSANLNWTDASKQPDIAAGYVIEQSTDNVHFSKVAAPPAGATSIAIGQLAKVTKYYFRIHGQNSKGDSPFSNIADATTTNQVSSIDFSGGFADAKGKMKFNGVTALSETKLRLTDGANGEASSAYCTNPVDITAFNTQFTFRFSPGSTADGMTFIVQNAGLAAVGPQGGGLGYGAENAGDAGGLGKSVAIKFDLYDNSGEGPNSTGLYKNGNPPTNAGSIDLTPSGIDLHSGDTFDVSLNYDGTTLKAIITDTKTGKSATQNYKVDIQKAVGGGTAYAGFTAATGGAGVTTDVMRWTFSPSASTSPNAPSGLGSVAASATSVNLNWTSNAPNQAGYHLDRATDAAFTKSVVAANIPSHPDSYTDTAVGLAPGETFYYRLRQPYNAAGDSGNSNVAHVTIPLAPPKPSNQKLDAVTATEISITWQDNAGHQTDGYKILRTVNHGAFTVVATLPPTSRPAPSPYSWTDSNLTPGTYYEYHILAYNVSGNNDFAGINATTPAK